MSVYKPRGTPFYQFDFQLRGRRFHGSTKCANRRDAEKVERLERERAKAAIAAGSADATSLTIDIAVGRYWEEVGKHHVASADTWRDLGRLVDYFGAPRRMMEIDDNEVTKLVAWRRGHRVERKRSRVKKDAAPAPLISNATVNRSTTEVLKKLFTRAKVWGVRFDKEPVWRDHMLPEPVERVRELLDDEGDRLSGATRADYAPFFDFAQASGLRLRECLLRWSEVNWEQRQIIKKGKGGKIVVVPITDQVRAILWPLRGHHAEFVFTYVALRTRGERVRGQRYPITRNGLKTTWKRLRKKAGVVGFRFHDFRHDLGTKLLRMTGNLKLVQKALNHADIKTTTRYAHVLDDEVATALDGLQKSRTKSRSKLRDVS